MFTADDITCLRRGIPLERRAADEIERLTEALSAAQAALTEYGDEMVEARAEIERLCIPICIGKPIIQILAKEGGWKSENGNAVIAADELFHHDPYAEIERLQIALGSALGD